MHKPSILMIVLAAAFAAGSTQARTTVAAPSLTDSVQIAKKGTDDRQRDDRGGNRLRDDQRDEQVAREGGVRGRGRGI